MNEKNPCVFVVDDDASIRDSLTDLLGSAGLNVQTFASAQEFLTSPRPQAAGCLVLDVQLPGLSGLDLQQELAKLDAQLPIIFITGHGDIPMTVRAMKAGAIEFLTKPFRDDDLLNAVEQAIHSSRQIEQFKTKVAEGKLSGKNQPRSETGFPEIVGRSATLRRVLKEVETVASTDSTVLITGETGTGKELIARAIHKRSRRSSRAFVSVNCAAIPQSLIASELFGHEKGAFTGALQRRVGRFELAAGGTIFLDEIGDLPADTQTALLRVLQEREFERVGGSQSIRADVRVIAATNRDLKAAMTAGTFRNDLFYRLNVFPIDMPPLRERRDDIPLLVECFIARFASKAGKQIRGINQKSLELLQAYRWPGNIRELQNVIERSVIVGETEDFVVDAEWLARESVMPQPLGQPLSERLLTQEKDLIEAALAETKGQVSRAAATLGLPRSTLESKIRTLKIDTQRFKTL
jgi:formate hydrogenlyase transcriptional activator